MRVSTGMIFDAGVASINRQTASLLNVQQQVASGRRILRPSDDPVAAARALEVTQASDVVAQFKRNQDVATSALGLEEVQLASVGDVLGRVRELAVQAGNTNLSSTSRKGIATELRARFDQLLGIANATDGNGQHIFSGYMGAVTPFGGSVDDILAGNEIVYQGDDGQRTLQVSPSRFIEVSDSGGDVFKRIRNGNGYFVTDYAAGNAGTGVMASGSVTDPAAWNAAATKNVSVEFTVAAGVTTYDLIDTASSASLLAGGPRVFQSGQPILLGDPPAFSLGASVTINGKPASGDRFYHRTQYHAERVRHPRQLDRGVGGPDRNPRRRRQVHQ
ncbi:MAG: flagellar hook-associated protein FlgL [Sulfuritalea sp.]|nr:flagellar hook-associated protein FlgL [Sulfuritalea sp.]